MFPYGETAVPKEGLLGPVVLVDVLVARDLILWLWEELCDDVVEVWIVSLHLLAGVDPVVLAVTVLLWNLGIHVEPVLNALCPVFLDVGSSVGILVLAGSECLIKTLLEALVDVRTCSYQTYKVD